MGDINLDLARSKSFTVGVYSLAAAGALVGLAVTSATALPGLAAAGAIGALVGGIGVPVGLTVAAVAGYGLFVAGKALFTTLKKEGAVLPLGIALVTYASTKALFYTPFQAAFKKLTSAFNSKAAPAKPSPAPQQPEADPPAPKP